MNQFFLIIILIMMSGCTSDERSSHHNADPQNPDSIPQSIEQTPPSPEIDLPAPPDGPLFGVFFPTRVLSVPSEMDEEQWTFGFSDINQWTPPQSDDPEMTPIFEEAAKLHSKGINTIIYLEPMLTKDLFSKLYALRFHKIHTVIWIQNLFKFNFEKGKRQHPDTVALPCRDYKNKGYVDIRKTSEVGKLITYYQTYFKTLSPLISFIMLDDHIGFNFYKPGLDQCLKYSEAQKVLNEFVQEFQKKMKECCPQIKTIIAHHPLSFAKRYFAADWSKWPFDLKMFQGYVEQSFSQYKKDLNSVQGIILPLGRKYPTFSYCGAVSKGLSIKKNLKSVLFFRTHEDSFSDKILNPLWEETCQ